MWTKEEQEKGCPRAEGVSQARGRKHQKGGPRKGEKHHKGMAKSGGGAPERDFT